MDREGFSAGFASFDQKPFEGFDEAIVPTVPSVLGPPLIEDHDFEPDIGWLDTVIDGDWDAADWPLFHRIPPEAES